MPRLDLTAAAISVLLAAPAAGDAIVKTRAMTASTIAEVFVEEGRARVEVEIGVADLGGFQDLLPDELFEELGQAPEPYRERLARFFREGLVLRAEGGEPLPGELLRLQVRPRVRRDEITGEPLPAGADGGELVVFAELAYELPGRPASLSLQPPFDPAAGVASANVGFVLYHAGLPALDFRYLSREEVIDLDWSDPWFSRFRNKNLRRQYDSPIFAFLYVEPFEVRKEIVARPRDLQRFVDLGLAGGEVIRAEEQPELLRRIGEFLGERAAVTIDGRRVEPTLDRIHFLRRTLKQTGVIDPPEDLPSVSALVGAIFVYPIASLPEAVEMEWDLFDERLARLPTVATDEAGGLPALLTADDPILRWQNFLTAPTVPGLVEVAPPAARRLSFPLASVAFLTAAAFALGIGARGARRGRAPLVAGLALGAAVLAWPLGRVPVPSPFASAGALGPEEAGEVLEGLLSNVYRAFDHRDEGAIYDTLARSASGELLTEVYLETRRALELENQGGARAKVDEVEVLEALPQPLAASEGFAARCVWVVGGSIGHWGHVHRRRNRYEAELSVEPLEGVWKLTGIELLSEERL